MFWSRPPAIPHQEKRLSRRVSLTLILSAMLGTVVPAQATASALEQQDRLYPQTGYSVPNDRVWGYFSSRGAEQTFGFPQSNVFTLLGFDVQIFQRHILQIAPDGVRPMNILDPDVLPVSTINFATFPAHDPAVATTAPGSDAPNYGNTVVAHIQSLVPNQWEGQQVNFLNVYLASAPADSGDLAPLVALEIWGFPTSLPAYDPNNGAFVYQRFQRGFLHFDATTGFTGGILLGDAFISVLYGHPNPPDLAAQAQSSRFWAQFDPSRPNRISRPDILPGSDLTTAFDVATPVPAPIVAPPLWPRVGSPEYGASVFLWGAAATTGRDLGKLQTAGMTWQKTLFQWRFIEPQRGRFDWGESERLVKASNAAGIKVVARIDFHPAWARSTGLAAFNGPPDNYQDFGNFIFAFVDHFKTGSPNGTVHAIELWNEPNLSREWGNATIGANSAADYVRLMCIGHQAAKRASQDVITISAGLSPTGVNDAGSRDDLLYLREMYAAGASPCFDALGAHGNTQAPTPQMEIGSWPGREHGSFYFRRVEQLREVMVQNGDADKQVWILEFGWTSDTVHPQYSWFRVSEDQKARNIVDAFRWAYDRWRPWIGPMILWNIAASDWNESREEFWWSVTFPSGANRPAYDAIVAARRSGHLP